MYEGYLENVFLRCLYSQSYIFQMIKLQFRENTSSLGSILWLEGHEDQKPQLLVCAIWKTFLFLHIVLILFPDEVDDVSKLFTSGNFAQYFDSLKILEVSFKLQALKSNAQNQLR